MFTVLYDITECLLEWFQLNVIPRLGVARANTLLQQRFSPCTHVHHYALIASAIVVRLSKMMLITIEDDCYQYNRFIYKYYESLFTQDALAWLDDFLYQSFSHKHRMSVYNRNLVAVTMVGFDIALIFN